MSDRELLELAAKAAGVSVAFTTFSDGSFVCHHKDGDCFHDEWNPLTDDGDALRLAVKLGMCVTHFPKHMDVMVGYRIGRDGRNESVSVDDAVDFDPLAATRLAIVRAAAEIGRTGVQR